MKTLCLDTYWQDSYPKPFFFIKSSDKSDSNADPEKRKYELDARNPERRNNFILARVADPDLFGRIRKIFTGSGSYRYSGYVPKLYEQGKNI